MVLRYNKNMSAIKNNKIKNKEYLPVLLLVLTVVSALLIIFSFSSGIYDYDGYDYCEGIPLAEATLRAGTLINPDYRYYYLIPVGPNVLMAPFVKLFGYTITANRMGMLVYYGMLMAAVWYLSGRLFGDISDRIMFSAVVNLFVYTYTGDNLLHHLLGYGIGLVCLMAELACVMAVGRERATAKTYVLLAVCGLWAAVNGEVTAALSSIPVILAVLYCGYRGNSLKKYRKALIILGCVTLAGMCFYKYLDAVSVSQHMYDGRFVLDTAGSTGSKLFTIFPGDYLKLFFYDPAGESVFSPVGILMLIRLGVALITLILPFLTVYTEKRHGVYTQAEETEQIFLYANLIVTAVCLGEYLLVQTSVLRYLFNVMMALFTLGAWYLTRVMRKVHMPFCRLVLILFAVLMTGKTALMTYPYGKQLEQRYLDASALLDRYGLKNGYTFVMFMEPMELYSNGEHRLSTIGYDEQYDQWHVFDDRVYTEDLFKPVGSDYFFVLTENSYGWEGLQADRSWHLFSQCRRAVKTKAFSLYIYDIDQWEDVFITEDERYE